jgi:hypothetical protein
VCVLQSAVADCGVGVCTEWAKAKARAKHWLEACGRASADMLHVLFFGRKSCEGWEALASELADLTDLSEGRAAYTKEHAAFEQAVRTSLESRPRAW